MCRGRGVLCITLGAQIGQNGQVVIDFRGCQRSSDSVRAGIAEAFRSHIERNEREKRWRRLAGNGRMRNLNSAALAPFASLALANLSDRGAMLACSSYASPQPSGFGVDEIAASLGFATISPSELERELLEALRRTLPSQTVAMVRYRPHMFRRPPPLPRLSDIR